MENKSIASQKKNRPALFDNGWMDRFFNAPLDEFFTGKMINVPAVNVAETAKDFRITIAAPGLDKKDFAINVHDDVLTISAEKESQKEKEEQQGHYNRREYNYTSWMRSFYLPDNGDDSKIEAKYENGELKITIAKKENPQTTTLSKNIQVN